jgi:toxin FitB
VKALLDTCVISELVSKQPNPKVVARIDSLDPEDVYLSVITIGEIVKGIEKLPKSRRKTDLQIWFKDELLIRFEGNIIALDTEALVKWGVLMAHLEEACRIMPAMDSLIVATALAKKMTLFTRNVSDFDSAGIEVANPWE